MKNFSNTAIIATENSQLSQEEIMQYLLGRTLAQFLNEPLALIALIIISVGVSLALLARRITRVARQKNDISETDKMYLTLKIIGLLMVVVGFVFITADIILYIFKR